MSLISKFLPSVLSIPQEVSLALGQLNLDFTLVKLEAPKEYAGAGMALTKLRKDNAENGGLHRTARKLGALFEGRTPDAPELLRAYGLRVSEICEAAKVSVTDEERHGLFKTFSGPDTAALWAAATSGTNAIAIHLLGCMIAEAFDGPKAVSLWVELIKMRKEEILRQLEGEIDELKRIAMDMATKQDVSREELAEWDNSARSWIRTANSVKEKERRQALLCTDRIGLNVTTSTEAYDSAMVAWIDAVVSMDSLIKGIPQKVRSGAVVLAMNAWHLYPDLSVLSRGPDLIHQEDRLIQSSGILTIDVEKGDEGAGVIWSLPLAYMRYYGEPVNVSQNLSVNTSRVSMNQFGFVLLGCVISTWVDYRGSETEALKILSRLTLAFRWPERSGSDSTSLMRIQKILARSSWIGQLLSAVEDYEDADETYREMAIRLMRYGHRNSKFLCNPEDHPPPLFGLCEIKPLFALLDGAEPRITYLRQLAKDLALSPANCVIRYVYTIDNTSVTEYASIGSANSLRGSDGFIQRQTHHHQDLEGQKLVRWLSIPTRAEPCRCKGSCKKPDPITQRSQGRTSIFKSRKKSCPCWDHGGCSIACHDTGKSDRSEWCETLHYGLLQQRMQYIADMGEICLPVHAIEDSKDPRNGMLEFGTGQDFRASMNTLKRGQKSSKTLVKLEFCAGSTETALILKTGMMTKSGQDHRIGRPGGDTRHLGEFLPAKTARAVFEPSHFNSYRLTEWFATDLRINYPKFVRPLRACASAAEMYGRLPSATISLPIVSELTIESARWIPASSPPGSSPLRLKLSRQEAFACVAMFESGRLIDPVHLQHVFAMASDNSIFVASPLLSDPYEQPLETEILRVHGNIGKPGLSFLVPPPDPRIKKTRADSWNIINHKPFNGTAEDNFRQTSVHLQLTQYQPELRSLNRDEHQIEQKAALRETLVQVYDGAEWIADLDVLGALTNSAVFRVGCTNEKHNKKSFSEVFREDDNLVTVDNWEELLTPPIDDEAAVMRTTGNWLARLAAVGVASRLKKEIIVVPNEGCWICIKQKLESVQSKKNCILIL